jgi:multidrug efflux system outer membrane protein
MRQLTLTLLLALGMAGCAVGPDYHRPAAVASQPVPAAFTMDGVVWKTAEPAAERPRGQWWTEFADDDLNNLESMAAAHNETVAASVAALSQAQALVASARSQYFPQISANPSYVRQRTSINAEANGIAVGTPYTYNLFTVPANLSWEVDLWGRVRRQTEGARARMSAAGEDLESLKLMVESEVAQDYFSLRAEDSEVQVLTDTAAAYQKSLDLTRNRRTGGVATDLDVSQAETQLRTTEAEIPALRLQRAEVLHAIAALCGQPAMTFTIAERPERNFRSMEVPSILPSDLLQRRPDIAAAERRVAAANADIGVATSAFYPSLTFNALAGFESVSGASAINWPSRIWALGPTVNMPIFTGGYNRAQLAAARAAYDAVTANYRQTTLGAFQEVEDELASQKFLTSQLKGENEALTSARQTLEIANNRYKAGLVTYLEVATSQTAELDLERTVVELEGERRVAAVGLIKALGGGWE